MKKSYLWAGLFSVIIAGWLGSGQLANGEKKSGAGQAPAVAAKSTGTPGKPAKLFKVEVRRFTGQKRTSVILVRGRTEAVKTLDVRARVRGIVEASPFNQGDRVKKGDILCRLDLINKKSQLAQAKALQASARRDFEAARKLVKRKFASAAKLATEKARLDAARAQVKQMQSSISWAKVKAPINGIVATRPAEQGSYLQVGQVCARLVVLDPILITGQVGERDIVHVKTGARATARLVTGERVSGVVRFISPMADVATRTFRIELQTGNAGRKIRDGITAEIALPMAAQTAHLLPAGIIGLNDDGDIGVRTLAPGNKVKWITIKVLTQSRKGIWVSGLPDEVELITTGQEYVLDGQVVDPVRAGPDKTVSADGARS